MTIIQLGGCYTPVKSLSNDTGHQSLTQPNWPFQRRIHQPLMVGHIPHIRRYVIRMCTSLNRHPLTTPRLNRAYRFNIPICARTATKGARTEVSTGVNFTTTISPVLRVSISVLTRVYPCHLDPGKRNLI